MGESWTTWGPEASELPEGAAAMLQERLGTLTPTRSVPLEQATVAPSRLRRSVAARFAGVVGDDAVLVDDAARARHASGQSYVDLVRRRIGDVSAAPDAVVLPGDADAVAQVVRICSEEWIAVVPWGGGTSVVGGLDPLHGDCTAVVALDLSRMNRLLHLDETSLIATFEPGIRTPDAEAALGEHGLTLGHVPQSYERASLGGYVVTRSAGQASTGVGRIDDLVVGARLATPAGELVLPALPASAAGPDLRRLVLGSEGVLGVLTEVSLRVRRLPDVTTYEGWMMPTWEAGLSALRRIAQEGPHPDVIRLSDPHETEVSLRMSRSGSTRRMLQAYLRLRRAHHGCLLITGYSGGDDEVDYRRETVRHLLRKSRAVPLGTKAGEAWEHSRFAAPRLRDSLLDAGALAETLETAGTWTVLPALYDAVRVALRMTLGDDAVVGCHVSHLYPTGASLYFTVIAAADSGHEQQQWTRAKTAANDAIVRAGGTITHHHAVGTAHRDHVTHDLGGPVGVKALRAMKNALDPHGVMNPGKLLPPR